MLLKANEGHQIMMVSYYILWEEEKFVIHLSPDTVLKKAFEWIKQFLKIGLVSQVSNLKTHTPRGKKKKAVDGNKQT